MLELNRRVRPVFLIAGAVAALTAHAISAGATLFMEPEPDIQIRLTPPPGTGSMNVTRTIDNDNKCGESRLNSRTTVPDGGVISPANQILAEADSAQLLIVPATWFAPHAVRLAFMATVNDAIDEHDNRWLHVASRSGDLAAVSYLLSIGADPQLRNQFHKSPLDVVYHGNALAHDSIRAVLTSPNHSLTDVFFRRVDANSTAIN